MEFPPYPIGTNISAILTPEIVSMYPKAADVPIVENRKEVSRNCGNNIATALPTGRSNGLKDAQPVKIDVDKLEQEVQNSKEPARSEESVHKEKRDMATQIPEIIFPMERSKMYKCELAIMLTFIISVLVVGSFFLIRIFLAGSKLLS